MGLATEIIREDGTIEPTGRWEREGKN